LADDVAGTDRIAGAHPDLLDHAVLLSRDGVLHLHGFEEADRLSHLDDVSHRDKELHNCALHGDGDLT
jgi:hypothetical protein